MQCIVQFLKQALHLAPDFLSPFMDQEINLNLLGRVLKNKKVFEHYMKLLKSHLTNKNVLLNIDPEFPGSHPVTLLRKHIELLCNVDYYVCEKSDGVRVFLWILAEQNVHRSFFVDRKGAFYECLDIDLTNFENCCFDGEIYLETINNKKQFIFAIFDTLMFNNTNVMEKTLLERLQYASKFAFAVRPCHKFKITVKKMYKSYGFCEVYKDIPKLNHKNDGMIFTPIDLPYIPGRCDMLLKWKPADLNTIDFRLVKHKTIDFMYNLMCIKGKNREVFFDFYFDTEMEITDRYDNLIGEFCFDCNTELFDPIDFSHYKGGWVLHKIRTDKETPNSLKVAINVLQSIKENISYKDLEKYFFEIRDNWKMRERERETKKQKLNPK